MKAKILSPDETPVTLTVSSFDVACAIEYIGSIADLWLLFALQVVLLKVQVATIQRIDHCLK